MNVWNRLNWKLIAAGIAGTWILQTVFLKVSLGVLTPLGFGPSMMLLTLLCYAAVGYLAGPGNRLIHIVIIALGLGFGKCIFLDDAAYLRPTMILFIVIPEIMLGWGLASLLVKIRHGRWQFEKKGQYNYHRRRADNLFQATERLKRVNSIPQLTYYMIDTPDGSLGKDINGYYSDGPLKTKGIAVENRDDNCQTIEFAGLQGDLGVASEAAATVAYMKSIGKYATLVLLMKCGHCGYESPVETEPGTFIRECYSCGVQNRGQRAAISVITESGCIEI